MNLCKIIFRVIASIYTNISNCIFPSDNTEFISRKRANQEMILAAYYCPAPNDDTEEEFLKLFKPEPFSTTNENQKTSPNLVFNTKTNSWHLSFIHAPTLIFEKKNGKFIRVFDLEKKHPDILAPVFSKLESPHQSWFQYLFTNKKQINVDQNTSVQLKDYIDFIPNQEIFDINSTMENGFTYDYDHNHPDIYAKLNQVRPEFACGYLYIYTVSENELSELFEEKFARKESIPVPNIFF